MVNVKLVAPIELLDTYTFGCIIKITISDRSIKKRQNLEPRKYEYCMRAVFILLFLMRVLRACRLYLVVFDEGAACVPSLSCCF